MELLAPLGLLALGLSVPLVAMYFHRRQDARREVSSLYLWRAVDRELSQRTGLQKLRRQSSLLLHLLALALVAFALAVPLRRATRTPAGRLVLVVDTTVSMSARAGTSTRLDLARQEALRALQEVVPGGEVTVIESGCVPRVAVPTTRERALAAAGIRRLTAHDCGGDLSRALSLAGDRLRGAGGLRRVVVLTDGTTRADAVGVSLPARLDVRMVGQAGPNVGLVAAELREDLSDAVPGRASRRFGLFVAMVSTEPARVTVRAELMRGAERETVALRVTDVPVGRASVTLPMELRAQETADLVRVSLERDAPDAMAADDVAWAPVPTTRELPVRLVVSARGGSPWVRRALASDPLVRVEELTRAEWNALSARPFEGLTVFHDTAPEAPLSGECLVFASTGSRAAGFALGAAHGDVRLTDSSPTDPRVRFVGIADVHVPSARAVEALATDVALIASASGPLVLARDSARGSTTLVAFDPNRTDWPLRPGFVLFVRDAVEHARELRGAAGIGARRTGAIARIAAPGVTRVRVRSAQGGMRFDLPTRDAVAEWADTDRAGVYVIDRGRGEERVGLSVLDPTESALGRAELPWRGAVTQEASATGFETREVGFWAALVALFALAVEWWTHTGARLRSRQRAA